MSTSLNQKYPSIQRFGLYTAILLILGVLFPILVPGHDGLELMFVNFYILDLPVVPFSAKLYVLFPLLGGILCIVALFLKNNIGRSILYLTVGFMPYFLALIITNDIWNMLDGFPGSRGGFDMPSMSVQLSYLMPIGLMGLIVAAFVGSNDRENRVAPWLALGGGSLLFLMLIIPTRFGESNLGDTPIIWWPIKAMEEDFVTGFIILSFVVLIVAACLLGILWGAKHKTGLNHALRIKILLRIAFLELVVFGILLALVRMDSLDKLQILLVILFGLLKVMGMFVAPFYAKCLGFMEIVTYIGAPPTRTIEGAELEPFNMVRIQDETKESPFSE
jgi:hypothetical protein